MVPRPLFPENVTTDDSTRPLAPPLCARRIALGYRPVSLRSTVPVAAPAVVVCAVSKAATRATSAETRAARRSARRGVRGCADIRDSHRGTGWICPFGDAGVMSPGRGEADDVPGHRRQRRLQR